MNPRVQDVEPLPGYRLQLRFANNELKIFECLPFLDFGVFSSLRDINYFNQVKVLDGTVVWPGEQDICPDTLYVDSIAIATIST